ncbi:MAG TPA: thrombospondin type 3 repeat-containing protein [Polyangiaceae bacterium LLY-WYZ-14_1]|nr:thrombospondin type 3 repeat-containing protein [Polyangiaceae bacterium LLY-WYZ-14_1]
MPEALGQTIDTDDFSAATFRPAPGPSAYFMADGGEVEPLELPYVALILNYANDPLVIDCVEDTSIGCDDVAGDQAAVVRHMTQFHLMVGWAFNDVLQLSLDVPLTHVSGDAFPFTVDGTPNTDLRGGATFGLGDLRLHMKLDLGGGVADGLSGAVVVFAGFPTGHATLENRYVGDELPMAGAHLVGELLQGPVAVAVNLGGILRRSAEVLEAGVASGLTFALAGRYRIVPIFEALAELTGQTSFGAADDQIELRFGGRFILGDFRLGTGLGVGLADAPGVPDLRFLVSAEYLRRVPTDTDRDGVPDDRDPCPAVPEDQDGFQDEDGCPDEDDDGDGVPDVRDPCPRQAEDLDGVDDEDGCPDGDNDRDGVPDGYDSCPETPEDLDGDRDDDGCPDDDEDGDGIHGAADLCPDQPEDTDGLEDTDGCPDDDVDGDGVPDHLDECPEIPEPRIRRRDRDGCPD